MADRAVKVLADTGEQARVAMADTTKHRHELKTGDRMLRNTNEVGKRHTWGKTTRFRWAGSVQRSTGLMTQKHKRQNTGTQTNIQSTKHTTEKHKP